MSTIDQYGNTFDGTGTEMLGLGGMMHALSGRSSAQAVLDQEAQGGAALLHSDLIPTERYGDAAAWETLGFVFGEKTNDPLFQKCTLPEGWTRKGGSSDPRHSTIVDERGVERVSVSYKAASYDRYATASLIAVGAAVAREIIYADPGQYADGEVPHLNVLTDAEKEQCVEVLRRELGSNAYYAQSFPERSERNPAIKAALASLGHPDAEPIPYDLGY